MIKEREAPKDSADRVFRRMSYTYALNIFRAEIGLKMIKVNTQSKV